ncbi:MAG: Lytic transglycosylase [uncultured Thiotrichaceae bacterium]|uniref:Lytic transglycosylase n=1 Tax=uncultured Thiotrichaceae bacterium TaxID=298394 RepID=A0A6S6SLR8_9GAMM|nr:MAG: Lytic transglycosylase [uncultured Thiotrichaceae bacterium]
MRKTVRQCYLVSFLFIVGFFLFGSAQIYAAVSYKTVYVYEKVGGGHLMTSKRIKKKGYSLIKKYKTRVTPKAKSKKKSSKKSSKKRSLSCRGMSARVNKHRRTIQVYSRVYGVEEALVHAIIKNESCYQKKAKSPVGAIGLMQLMPGTAKDMKISNPWDPEQNIQGGVKYISQMLSQFKGNKKHALAAYNAGPGKVRRYKGIPPYRETRGYVKKVMADYHRFKKNSP